MKKNLPNIITSCNLICGCIATVFAINGQAPEALSLIILGAVFDFFDGMTARLLHVSGEIGKELDSLADDITFGLAPSAMIYAWLQQAVQTHMLFGFSGTYLETLLLLLPYTAFVMAAFSAYRLAKFNLDTRQTTSFIGLPTPANALFWASLLTSVGKDMLSSPYYIFIVMAAMLLSCWLLVSELPLFALKFKSWGWHGNETKYVFILSAMAIIAVFRIAGIAATIVWYILLSLFKPLHVGENVQE